MDIVRVFTGPDGQSHFEDVAVALDDLGPMGLISKRWPGSGVQFREVDGDYHLDYHVAPRRQLVVNLTCSIRSTHLLYSRSVMSNLGAAVEVGRLNSHGVHDCAEVIDSFLERQTADSIGLAGSPLVEDCYARRATHLLDGRA